MEEAAMASRAFFHHCHPQKSAERGDMCLVSGTCQCVLEALRSEFTQRLRQQQASYLPISHFRSSGQKHKTCDTPGGLGREG